jgi:hypothetical protein
MSTNGDDAQHDMEKKALRNVRGLVEKVEAEDRIDAGSQKKALLVIGIATAVVIVGGALIISSRKDAPRSDQPAIEIPPPAKPAAPK